MPVLNRFADFHDEITAWRRDLHENPELLYEVHRTARTVADRLNEFGLDEVVSGIGRTGVVGIIKGKSDGSGKVIGLRADMDALPIKEASNKPYASKNEGKMHACGHDGHTAMLLGAAKYLAETRNFDGTVAVIFQPAEEGGAGAKAMIDDGLLERWNIQEVYGMHNFPGMDVGSFGIRSGPLMAATDEFQVEIEGVGGHAARPNRAVDPIIVAAQVIQALQTIVSRNVDPLESAVITVTAIHAGDAFNVIPQKAKFIGTCRSLRPHIRDQLEERFKSVVTNIVQGFGARVSIEYMRNYPVTINHDAPAAFAGSVAAQIVGDSNVDMQIAPVMGGEDFSYMLEARPGAFIFVGNGDSAGLHNEAYDFNDDIIPIGCSYWAKLVESAMPAS